MPDPLDAALDAFDQTRLQLVDRLDGMADHEYFWEPVDGCWNVRPVGDGGYIADFVPDQPQPAPFTTIAWRLWHIAVDCMEAYSRRVLGSVTRPDDRAFVGSADESIDVLETSLAHFAVGMGDFGDDVWVPLGPDWGPHAEKTRFDLLLHAHRELTHHGAEIGLIRDLYRQRAAWSG